MFQGEGFEEPTCTGDFPTRGRGYHHGGCRANRDLDFLHFISHYFVSFHICRGPLGDVPQSDRECKNNTTKNS